MRRKPQNSLSLYDTGHHIKLQSDNTYIGRNIYFIASTQHHVPRPLCVTIVERITL